MTPKQAIRDRAAAALQRAASQPGACRHCGAPSVPVLLDALVAMIKREIRRETKDLRVCMHAGTEGECPR